MLLVAGGVALGLGGGVLGVLQPQVALSYGGPVLVACCWFSALLCGWIVLYLAFRIAV